MVTSKSAVVVCSGNGGAGVHVYIVDTGVRVTHSEFVGRVGLGYNAADPQEAPDDIEGHGTHCAGTALGSSMGVARNATLHAVQVFAMRR